MSEKIVSGKYHPESVHDCITLASADPEKNLLLLADLYPPHLSLSEVYVLIRSGIAIDFSTLYHGFASPSIVLGMKVRTKQLLLEHVLSRVKGKFMCICEPEEIGLFGDKAEILETHNECQMILRNLAEPTKVVAGGEAKRVEKGELDALDRFYRENNAFAWLPVQFASGPYFCVKEEGRIVSAGGVHFTTPKIAQLGNIITAESSRKKGYATLCTYALVSELSSTNRIVSLFVVEDNNDAIRIYEKIGFQMKRKVVFATLSTMEERSPSDRGRALRHEPR